MESDWAPCNLEIKTSFKPNLLSTVNSPLAASFVTSPCKACRLPSTEISMETLSPAFNGTWFSVMKADIWPLPTSHHRLKPTSSVFGTPKMRRVCLPVLWRFHWRSWASAGVLSKPQRAITGIRRENENMRPSYGKALVAQIGFEHINVFDVGAKHHIQNAADKGNGTKACFNGHIARHANEHLARCTQLAGFVHNV